MKAYALTQFGDDNVFQEMDLPKPQIKPNHVLIKVMATSVNPLDYKLRKGYLPHLIQHFPAILQGDVAGIVEEVGEGVTAFAKDDKVYGCVGGFLDLGGGLAEYVLADADLIAHMPKTLSFREAAALPLVSEAAWEGLFRYANIQPNNTVLVHGATGGVGHIVIQLAKYCGAKVFATASSAKKMTIAKSLGADVVINYQEMKVADYVEAYTNNKGFDIVFDPVGGENLIACFEAATNYGQVVTLVARGMCDLTQAALRGLSLHIITQPLPLITGQNRAHYGKILTKIAELVDEHRIKPLIDEKHFKISDVAKAHQYLESHQAMGKVVLSFI